MKRIVTLFLLPALGSGALAGAAAAQTFDASGQRHHGTRPEPAFGASDGIVSFGLGLGVAGIYGTSSAPAVTMMYDHGVAENVSAGAFVGYSSSTYHDAYYQAYGYDWGWKYSYGLVGVRGDYHFSELLDNPKLDAYAGAMLGYNHVTARAFAGSQTGSPASASYVLYGAHAGARYFFSPKLAGFAELGYGVGELAAGVSFKL